MELSNYKLEDKKQLNHDVYELIFSTEDEKNVLAGQFITFMLPITKLGRAYSIANKDGNKLIFLIKKLENGRGGSKEICELNIGDEIKGVGPAGHFTLNEEDNNKMFIGTGVGFAPLYYQIIKSLNNKSKIKLIFGLREEKDIFYKNQLDILKEKYSNFEYEIIFSRENVKGYKKGYTTDLINENYIKGFKEFYICGSPSVIESSIQELKENNIKTEQIFFEKY